MALVNPALDAPHAGEVSRRSIWPIVGELRQQLHHVPIPGPVLVESNTYRIPEYFTYPVMAELSERGIAFDVTAAGDVINLGSTRRDDGSANYEIFLRHGADAKRTPAGAQRLAYVDGGADVVEVGVFIQPRL